MDDSLPSVPALGAGCPVRGAITARNLGAYVTTVPDMEWRGRPFAATIIDNPYPTSLPGGVLHARFVEGLKKASSKELRVCFHGTPPENIDSILLNSLNPALRRGQAHGPGEYL